MVEGVNWTVFAVESASSTDWTTILVALVTGLTAAGGPALMHVLQTRKERLGVRAALIAEVTALAAVIRARGYCEDLHDAAVALQAQEAGGPAADLGSFKFSVPEDYNLIYRQNADKLGCLNADEAAYVVRFYKLLMAVVADVSPGGSLYEGEFSSLNFTENRGLFLAALEIADELGKKVR